MRAWKCGGLILDLVVFFMSTMNQVSQNGKTVGNIEIVLGSGEVARAILSAQNVHTTWSHW